MQNTTSAPLTVRTFRDLPGPRGLPILGNALQMDPSRLHQVIEDWCDEFGCPYRLRMGGMKGVVISDPVLIRQALQERPHSFRRFASLQSIAEELGIFGLFPAEGETWQRHRRAWMRALSMHQIKPFFEQLSTITGRLQRRWEQAADNGEAVDVQADLMRYTVDVTTLFAFGVDTNTLEQEGDRIQQHLGRVFYMVNRRLSMPVPYWRWFKLPVDRRLDRSLQAVGEFVRSMISEARKRIAADPALAEKPTNLLEALIVARDDDGSTFTDQEIYGNTMVALLAGEDTTANTLSWMIHMLSQHAPVQASLQAEADRVLDGAAMMTDLEDAASLPYIDALMSETLRLRPVAPLIFLCANEDTQLGDLFIEAGTNVLLAMRKSAEAAGEFDQPQQFDPARWLEEKRRFELRPPMPFGGGPRICPGRNLAQMEIKSVTSMLARNFTVSDASEQPVREKLSFTLVPANLRVRLQRR